MGGIVYSAQPDPLMGMIGPAISVTAGGVIPPGKFFGGAWSANVNGTMIAMGAGVIDSDGQATLTAAGSIYPIGAGNPYLWPWRNPWPVGIS